MTDILDDEQTIAQIQAENAALRQEIARLEATIAAQQRVMHALETERNNLLEILDQIPAFVYLQAPDYSVRFANRYFREHFPNRHPHTGRSPQCYELFAGRSQPCECCPTFRVFADPQTPQIWEATPIDGHTYQIYDYPYRDSEGALFVLELGIDITERRQAEEEVRRLNAKLEQHVAAQTAELHASQALLQGVIDHMPSTLYIKDIQGHYLQMSKHGANLLHLDRAQILGKTDDAIFPTQLVDTWRHTDQQVVATGQPLEFDLAVPLDDGIHSFLATKFPIYDMHGNICAIGGSAIDITARVRAEKALRLSEEHFRRTFDQSPIGAAIVALDYHFVRVNDALCRITGYERHELLALGFPDITYPDDLAADVAQAQQLVAGQIDQYRMDKRYIRKDNQLVWIHLSVRLVRNSNGQPLHFLPMMEDITERKRAEQQNERQLKQLQALREIDLAITASLDLRLTLNIVLRHITTALHIDAAAVLLLNPVTQTLDTVAEQGFRLTSRRRSPVGFGAGYTGRVVIERQPLSIPDLHRAEVSFSPASLIADEGFIAYYGLPLIAKGQVKGVLELLQRTGFHPSPEDLAFLESLAGQAAIAINNAELFERLQRANNTLVHSYDATIEGWAHALELRDAETEGHSRRVTALTMRLAQALDYNDAELIQIRRGAILHDIGKMAIPDTILLKPGPLSAQEWTIMRQHPIYAYQLLAPIPFLRPALAIPYYHHEKWDGTGYPRGLKGEDIPLSARIFAVVDVWDALSSDRPYRKGWTRDQICAYIYEQAGKHFDPQVVKLFLTLMSEATA